MRERLHKVLAHIGVGSRRDCEELIAQGRVSVDGKTVTELGTQVDGRRQEIKVDGRRVKLPPLAYYLLNKPRGVVCSAGEDERGTRAIDLAPRGAGRLHTVGRLDKESEGLLILTNDGELTERLTHPRHDFPKRYVALVKGRVPGEALERLRKGVWLAEGKATVTSVKVLRATPAATQLEVELREGKNREIRRILARVGHPVKELRRVAIGPIELKGLGVGKARPLSQGEVEMLREAVGRGAGEGKPGPGTRPKARKPGPGTKPPRPKPAPAAAEEPVSEPVFPAEPEHPKARYVPDEDGVIVVRRAPGRSFEEE